MTTARFTSLAVAFAVVVAAVVVAYADCLHEQAKTDWCGSGFTYCSDYDDYDEDCWSAWQEWDLKISYLCTPHLGSDNDTNCVDVMVDPDGGGPRPEIPLLINCHCKIPCYYNYFDEICDWDWEDDPVCTDKVEKETEDC